MSPVPWYLIEHRRGTVVIDGGNAPEVAVDPFARGARCHADFVKPRIPWSLLEDHEDGYDG